MKYKARKLIAVLMIWVMVFNIIPVSSVADPGDSHEFSQSLDQSAFNQRGATPGYTVQVIIDQTLSYDKPLYLVFKNVEWTEADQWNQFYSTKHAVQQLTLSDPDTTYSSTGRDYYTRDRQGDAESHTVFLATGPDWRGYAVDGELLTNNPDACKYYRDGDTIGNDKTVSITASGDNYIIRIGSAEPVPYTASVSGITSSDPLDAGAYCVVARVGNAYYYAPIGADGSVGSFADGAGYNEDHLPDRAAADSVKVVEYDSSMTPQQLAGKAHCSRLNAAGGEQYRLSACTPDDTAHNYGFTATPAGGDSVIITIRNTGTSALALESVQYYLVAGWNDGIDSYQAVRLDGSHPEGTYSFAIDLPSGKSWDNLFVLIKSYPLGDTSDPRDNSHGTLVIAHPEKVLNAVSNPNTITDGQDQYRFTLSDRAEENGKQKYTIDIQKIERAKHTAVVTIPDGVSTDNLYVVFRQPIANSNEKAYCAVRVTGSGEYDSTSTLINPNYGTQAFSADAETEVVLITTGNNPDTSAWMFQNTNFNTNNGLTVYRPGDAYLGNSDNTVTIIPDSAEPDKKTSVSIGAVSFTARIDFYDAWNVPHTDPVSFTPVTVSASNGTDAFSGTVSASGEFLTEYELPANLDSWTFSSDDLGGYILSGTTPAKEGTVYVFEAHKPDTYNVEIRYLEAWGGTEVQDVSFAAAGTITAEAGGQTFTGTINTDGSVTMDPVPAITTWTINTDNTIEGYVFKPSDTVGQENPSIDSGTHTYILTLREARTYRVEIEYYDSWNRGKISGDVAVGSGYTIEATDAAGTVHTGTVDPDTGAAVFDHMLPEITGWTVKHNGAAEDPQMIGGFRAVFDSTNPSETSRFDPALNDAAGYYVIAVTKPNTYSAGLSFYAADAEDPLDSVTLPETYVIMATAAEDGAVLTGTVGTDGQITWENNVTELPKISEFRFFKADGTTAVTRFGDYVLGVESYEDDDLRATAGAYQIIGRAAKLYPSTIEYLPENTAGLNAYYYLVASVEGVRTAYAAVTAATSRLTFIPFGAASSLLHLRMYRAESGGSASATGIQLPEDAAFELIRSDAELDAAGVYSAAAAPAVIDDYTLELTPVIEQTHDGSGTITEDTLVFKAQKMWTGDTIRISTYDYNGTTLLAPDTNFGNDYFLRVCIRRQSDNGIEGWTLIPLDQWKQSGQGDTAEIKVTRFTQLGQYPLNLADNSDAWKDFNSSTHYIEVDTDEYPARVVKITDKNQLDWYKATNPTFVNDDPPEGYKYTKGSQEADGYRIRLKKAKPVEYRVRLDFDTADTTKINLDGGLYVKVTIGHQSSQDTYGWVRVDNANFKKSPYMTVENGHTYIDVPVTEWKNANGDIINGEKYKGTEDNIKVELVGAAAQYGNQPTPGGSAPMKVGSYVNNAEVTAYPTMTEGKDRITDDTAADKTVITDIVTLKLEPDSFDGYSLEYILNGYNIVTLCPNTVASPSNSGESAFGDGDFLMKNHCMGGVLIRGDIIHITGTGVADSEYITKPSVVGGYVPASSGPFINNRENNNNNWNAYVGSVNTVEGETVNGVTASGSPSKPRPDGSIRGYTGSAGHTAAYGDTYVDWDRLQQTVLDDSDSMAAAGRTIDNIRYTDEWGNPIREVHIDVTLGDNVTVNYPEGVKLIVNIIAPEGLDLQNSKNIPSTIINNTGTGTYIAPKVTVNGKDMSTVEDGSGMSLVWNYPKAARVDLTTEVTPFFGHIVAPRSYINVEGGNYSGCMVGNKVSSAGEGHLYPYNGGKLVITDVGFEASKAIDDLPADPDKLFYFNLEELDRDGKLDNRAGEWVLLEMVRNKSEKIEFAQIEYQNAGTYYYRISEYQHSVSSDIRMDTTQYIVKSVVTPVVSGTTTTLVAAQTYYRVPDGVTDYIESYTENEETRYRIDESALTPLSVPEGASGAEIAAQYLTFNNTSNSNSGITVRKTLTGETLSGGQFTFTIEKKSGPDASVGTVNEDKLTSPAANNDAGVASFGKLSFTLADGQNSGVWVYTVKEVQPDPIPAGYVYDQSEYEITFTVTRSEGTLNVAKACRKVKNADGTGADEAVDGISFTNRRELGSLTISKTVVSPVPAEATQAFRFTVTLQLNGKALSGKYGDYTFDANGQATITVAGGSSVTIPDLPTGTTYTVVEAAETGFTTGHGTGSGWTDGNTESGTIASAGNTAAFRNTRETGGLSISKTVVSPFGADAGKTFTFSVALSDRTISGTFAGTVMPGSEACDVVFLDGEASVTVAGGHTLTVEGLPTGVTWTVTEATDDNFSAAQAELSGDISAALSEAAFTNTRKTGDLQVGKQVTGTSDKTKTFTFTVTLKNGTTPFGGGTYPVNVDHVSGDQKTQFEHTDAQNNTVYTITFGNDGTASFDLKADEYVVISGLPVGLSYTVGETTATLPGGYEISSAETAAGSISTTAAVETFVNNYRLETTSVGFGGIKHIEGTDSTEKVFTFELYETDDTYDITGKTPRETVSTEGLIGTAGQDYTFSTITYDANMLTGTPKAGDFYYVIKEQALDQAEGWIIDGNKYRIHVHVQDDAQGHLSKTVTVTAEDASGTVTASTATAGTLDFTNSYTASGDVIFGAKKTMTGGKLADHPVDVRVTLVDGRNSETPVCETGTQTPVYQKTATLALNSDIQYVGFDAFSFVKETGRDDTEHEYWFLIEEVLPAGVTPQDPVDHTTGIRYDTTQKWIKVTVSDEGDGRLTAVKDPAPAVTTPVDLDIELTNEQLGGVQVTKVFSGHAAPAGFAVTAEYQLSGQNPTALQLTIDGANDTVAASGSGTENDPYLWTIEDLPLDTVVTFTESGMTVDGYAVTTSFNGTAGETGGTAAAAVKDGQGQYPAGALVNTYTRETGKMKIAKTATVNGSEQKAKDTRLIDGTYVFTVTGSGLAAGTSVTVCLTITGGVVADAEITQRTNASAVIISRTTGELSNLPTGEYTVTEDLTQGNHPAGVTLTASPAGTITVAADQTAGIPTAAFTNNREVGDLQISKSVTGTTDKSKDFEFTVVLTKPADADLEAAYPVTATAGVRSNNTGLFDADDKLLLSDGNANQKTFTIKLRADESITVLNLPAGTEYTVTEVTPLPGGYEKTEPSGDPNGLIGRDLSEAAFINNYTLNTTAVGFGGVKSIEGTDSTATQFAFELYQADNNRFNITGKTAIQTVTTTGTIWRTAGKSFNFEAITYSGDDLELNTSVTPNRKEKHFYYVIREKAFSEANGWTICGDEYEADVFVWDNGDGTLAKSITLYKNGTQADDISSGAMPFINTYEAAGTVSFSARKVFTNGTLKAHPFKIRLTYVTGENDDTPVDNNGVPVYQQEVTVDDDAESQTVNFTDVLSFIKNSARDDTQNTYWFLIEEIDDNADKTDIGYDAVAQRWISVTLTDNGHGGLDVTKSPAPAKEGGVDLDAVFTNEQLGGVQVTKAFSGHAAPAGFMITAEYQLAGQSETTLQLTTDGANGTQAPSSGTGAADNPYVWQIGGLPVGTEVTFTESGITVNDGYSVTATFTDAAGQQSTGTSGTVTADEQNQGNYPAGAFVNTYTRDTGSLKIKKTVQVNGAAPAAADCALVDGTYTFTVTGKGLAAGTDDKIVTVTIENGAVTGGTVADSTDPNNTTPIAPDADGYLVISGLPTGDYEITETITPEMTGKGIVLKEPAGNKVTVTVEANNTADIPAADFTNEKEIGGLEISKTVNGTTDNTKLFTFEVTLTAPATGATLGSAYPAVKTTGTGAGAATENVTVDVDGSGRVTINGEDVKLTAGQTLTISGLPKGTTYTVKEKDIPDGYHQTSPAGNATGTVGTGTSTAGFINDYTTGSTNVTFGGTKHIEGRDSTDKVFSFELYEADDDSFDITGKTPLQTVSTSGTISQAAGTTFSFDTITYTAPTVKYYVVKEKALDAATGWTIDEHTLYTKTVTVTDAGNGQLSKTVSPAGENNLDFTNSYEATGTVSFSAKKVFTNGDLSAHPFKIRLTYVTGENDDTPVDNNGVPVYQREITVNAAGNTQAVDFTNVLSFVKNSAQDDTRNTCWFLIEEIDENPSTDIGYDASPKRWISVTVADNGQGSLTVTKSPAPTTAGGVDLDAVFTNEQLGGAQVSKAFSGHTVPAGFMITAEYQLAGQGKTTLQLTTDGANGTQAPSSGTGAADNPYVWQIGGLPVGTEVTFTESGMTADGYALSTTFNGTANLTGGTVTAAQQSQGNYPAGALVNTYTRETGGLKIKKTVQVNGATPPAKANYDLVDGTYTFTLTGKGLAAGTNKTVTVTIKDGAVTGGTVADSADPANTTSLTPDADGYLVISGLPTGDYEITETITEEMTHAGIVLKDPAGNKATVTVGANNTANIPAADFTNEKEIGGLEISKTVNGTDSTAALFTFEITLTAPPTGVVLDSSYPAVKTTVTGAGAATENVTVNVDGSGKVTIGGENVKLTAGQTLAISELPKGTTYTVKEINIPDGYHQTSPAGNATGTIGTGTSTALFINDYSMGTTNVTFGGTKSIEGRDSTDKVFSFELYEADDDSFDITGKTPLQTVSTSGTISAAAGTTFSFDTITYTAPTVKYYVVKEKALDAATGWTIDEHTLYTKTVTVTDAGNGQLSKTVSPAGEDSLNFTNAYEAAGTVTFRARKVFTNGRLNTHPFKIRLTQVTGDGSTTQATGAGTVLAAPVEKTVSMNAGSQTVSFDTISFIKNKTQDDTQATYWFLIEEIDENPNTDIGYDASPKRWISVTVTDNGQGSLTVTKSPAPAKVGGVDLDAVFTNEQLGGVQVTKAFSGHAAPAGFMITAEYQLAGQGKTTLQLTTDGANSTIAATSGSGTAGDPYVWQIDGLPVGTEVTFTESGMTVDGYALASTFNGTANLTGGTVDADVLNQGNYPEGALINTYTRETGGLKIRKTVKLNGSVPTAAADCALVDGTYTFTLTGKGLASGTDKIVTVTVSGGAVTGGTVADSADPANTTSLMPDADGYLIISGLPTGDYEITETITPEMTAAGIVLKDPAGNKVTVTVEANNTANIPAADFTNEKETGDLVLRKTVSGTSDRTKLFTFEVTLTAPATGAVLDSSYPAMKTTVTGTGTTTEDVTADVGAGGKVTIGGQDVKLKADQSLTIKGLPKGTTYTIKETGIPTGYSLTSPAGVAQDAVTTGTNTVTFVNQYNLGTTSVSFGGTKSIEGTASTTTVFTFELYEADDIAFDISGKTAIQIKSTSGTVQQATGAVYSFDPLIYAGDDLVEQGGIKTKDFWYVVRERAFDTDNGWETSAVLYRIKVTVTDAGNGNLSKTVTFYNEDGSVNTAPTAGTLNFLNSYEAAGKVSFSAKKVFTNGDLSAHPFKIRLTYVTGENSETPVKNGGTTVYQETETLDDAADTQTVDFTDVLSFIKNKTQDDTRNTYWFLIQEIDENTDTADIGYDAAMKRWIKVTLTDNGHGGLDVTKEPAAVSDLDAVFTNEQLGGVKVQKSFSGLAALPDDFEITAAYNDGKADRTLHLKVAGTGTDVLLPAGGNGQAATPYYWEISRLPIGTEVTFTEKGYTVDGYSLTTTYTKQVSGADNTVEAVTGTLTAAQAAPVGTFVNEYTRDLGKLMIKKTVSINNVDAGSSKADPTLVDGTYSFTIKGPDPAVTEGKVTITIENAAVKSAAVDAAAIAAGITVTVEKGAAIVSGLPTGKYLVTEDELADNPHYITQTGGTRGTLTVGKDGVAQVQTAAFNNNRDVGDLKISKKVERTGDRTRLFTFEITLTKGTDKISGTFDATWTLNTGVKEEPITFDANGQKTIQLHADESVVIHNLPGGTSYTVHEDATSMPSGYTQTSPGGDATGTISSKPSEAKFVNTYELESIGLPFNGTKSITGRDSTTKEFEFELYDTTEATAGKEDRYDITGLTPLKTAKTTAAITASSPVTFSLGSIQYDQSCVDNTERSSTYYYVVCEKQLNSDGWTGSTVLYKRKVTVSDDGAGHMVLTVKDEKGSDASTANLAFVNSYEAAGTVSFSAEKTFEKGDLSAQAFQVRLTQVDGYNSTKQATEHVVLASPVVRDVPVSGTVDFTDVVSFVRNADRNDTEATYWFMLEEVLPDLDANNAHDNIQYDTTRKWIRVTLTDDGKGTLTAVKTPSAAGADAQFVNEQLGSVIVTKVFAGVETPAGFSITAEYQLPGKPKTKLTLTPSTPGMTGDGTEANPYVWEIGNLPIGTEVTFTENGITVNGYTVSTTFNGTAVSTPQGTAPAGYPAGADNTGAFVNTYTRDKGSLLLRKKVSAPEGITTPKTYTFHVRGEDGLYYGPGGVSDTEPIDIIVTPGDTGVLLEDLPTQKYTVREVTGADNSEISVAWTDVSVDYSGADATVTTGETAEATITNTYTLRDKPTNAAVQKIWKDDENRDGLRPASLRLELLANGEKTGKFVTLSETNCWSAVITNLPVKKDGKEITYSWSEPSVSGYTLTGNAANGTLTTLTNTHTPEETEIAVSKIWKDDDNAAGKRPASIRVQLYADGKAEGEAVTLNASNGWAYRWTGLKKNSCASGQTREIRYTVAETEIPEGYEATVTGSASTGFVIRNTMDKGCLAIEKEFDIQEPDKPDDDEDLTEIEVVKIWDDDDNRDGNRPESITVRLYAGGEEVRVAKLTAANGWRRKFINLPKYVNGHPIHYSVKEDPVEWYVPYIHGFTIRNVYQPEVTSVTVRKVWNDENDKLKCRPLKIRMTLSNGMKVVLSAENNWTATIYNLPTRINGKPVIYTWTEQSVSGYVLQNVSVSGTVTTFTNGLWTPPDELPPGMPPHSPSDTVSIDDYDTPLGVDVIINHVGDCFD